MRWRSPFAAVIVLVVLVVALAGFVELGPAVEEQDLEFTVVGQGDMSGFFGEAYLVVRSEMEWVDLWGQHTTIVVPSMPVPEIDFSSELVICVFMGEWPTAGYSITITRIWVAEEEAHVKVVKRCPPEGFAVADVITHPYMFVSIEKLSVDFTFEIIEEDGTSFEYLTPRQPDVNRDHFCGIDDVVSVVEHIGIKYGDADWLPEFDLIRDNYIGMDDVAETVEHFGEAY